MILSSTLKAPDLIRETGALLVWPAVLALSVRSIAQPNLSFSASLFSDRRVVEDAGVGEGV